MHAEVQEFSEVCQEGKLDEPGKYYSIGLGEEVWSY